MSTRAVYFFNDMFRDGKDSVNIYGVYKHYDNYPKGAAYHIEAAKDYAWRLPRFEADEFAAAFVAANKNKSGGEVRLIPLFDHTSRRQVMDDHKWCEYYYDITYDEVVGDLVVHTYEKRYNDTIREYVWELINYMPHQQMLRSFVGSTDLVMPDKKLPWKAVGEKG